MGYKYGAPVNNDDLNRILGDWHQRIMSEFHRKSAENQATLFEYLKKLQQQSDSEDKIIKVRLVK